MDPFDPEQLDLSALVRGLIEDLQTASLLGYIRGKTAMRDAVANRLHCSQLSSEELVDTLIVQGFAHYTGDPADPSPGYWVLAPRAT
jgi:hypothetical protein